MVYIDFEELVSKTQAECSYCSGTSATVMDLQKYPLTEFYKEHDDKRDHFGFVDQKMMFCKSCNHMFLHKVLDANKIYNEGNFLTSSITSKGAVECIDDFVKGKVCRTLLNLKS